MIGCCPHSDGWHGNRGCGFPECPCRRRILRRPPKTSFAKTCSECLHVVADAGHAAGCTRTGLGPDLPGRAPAGAAALRSVLR